MHLICLYGDPPYISIKIASPGSTTKPASYTTNGTVQQIYEPFILRFSVEWLFNDIVNYLKFIDFKKNLKVGLSAVGKVYIVCALLRNALTCLYGHTTSEFYDLDRLLAGLRCLDLDGTYASHILSFQRIKSKIFCYSNCLGAFIEIFLHYFKTQQ